MLNTLRSLQDISIVSPIQINQHQSKSMQATAAICTHHGVDLPDMHRYTSMSSYLFPQASFERLLAIDLLNAVLFYIDDVYDRNQKQVPLQQEHTNQYIYAQCGQIFIDGILPNKPHKLFPIWQELHHHFTALSSLDYRQRLVQVLAEHLQASRIPNTAFMSLKTNYLSDYFTARIDDSGMIPTLLLIEFAANQPIDQAVYQHPQIKRLSHLTALIAALLNDLFSYEKEVLWLDSRFNLVRLLMDAEQLSFELAVDRSILQINQLIAEFELLRTSPPTFAQATLQQQAAFYIQGLSDQLTAAWHWQLQTNRYRSPTSPFALLRELLPEEVGTY